MVETIIIVLFGVQGFLANLPRGVPNQDVNVLYNKFSFILFFIFKNSSPPASWLATPGQNRQALDMGVECSECGCILL